MSKKRILFITRYHYLRFTGGAELQCWMLAREFQRRGWDVHYISENNRPDAPIELDGVNLHYMPEKPHWRDYNKAHVQKVMNDLQPDVVYNRVFNMYTVHAIKLAPAHTVTIWAAATSNEGRTFSTLGDLWQTRSLPQFLVLLPRIIYTRIHARKAVMQAKLQLAQSREQVERLTEVGFHPVLLRNSLESLENAPTQTHEDKPMVLWVGSVKQWKRPELYFELVRRCADFDCEFVMAGELQDTQSKEPLARAQRELTNFRYAGFVPPEQIGKLYDKAHLFVSTSRSEGFPNTFTQAWLRGIPVVSLDVDPDGLLSKDGLGKAASSMDDLERKLRDLLADPNQRRDIGKRAQEIAKREFHLQSNVDKLEKLIEERMKK